jgi:hypothetical protein
MSFRRDPVPPRPPVDFELHRGEQVHLGASVWNRGNVFLGLYGQWHNESNDRNTVVLDLGLLVSNDALHYREPLPDFKFLPSYEEEDSAAPRLLQGQGFENVGDRTFFWYGIWPLTSFTSPTAIKLATWPRDRFGYFSPQPRTDDIFGGETSKVTAPHCISAPLAIGATGGKLFINADGLSDVSSLQVELLDEQLRPLPGFSGADSVALTKGGFRLPITWRGQSAIPSDHGKLRVRVNWLGTRAEAARLYAVYLE